jgi:hypothetical protein
MAQKKNAKHGAEQGMEGGERPSKAKYRGLAERWRRLAADATTPHTRNHLLKLARQCEFLALGTGTARYEPEELGFPGGAP